MIQMGTQKSATVGDKMFTGQGPLKETKTQSNSFFIATH